MKLQYIIFCTGMGSFKNRTVESYQKGKHKKSYEQTHWKYVKDPKKSNVCEQKYFKLPWGWELQPFEQTTEPLKKFSRL